MPRSDNPALQEREGALYSVGRDSQAFLVSHVFLIVVVDRLVLPFVLRSLEVVERGFVGNDHVHGTVNVLLNELVHLPLHQVTRRDEVQVTTTFADSNDWRFAFLAAAS